LDHDFTESSTMKKISALCLLALSPALALASLVSPSTSIGGSGSYTWTYGLQLEPLQKGTPGQPTVVDALKFDRYRVDSFFTIHAFAGYVDGSCAGPAGWTCSVEAGGDALDDLLLDGDTRTVDLTWTTKARALHPGSLDERGLGDFSAQSIYGDAATVRYTAYAAVNPGRWASSEAGSFGSTLGPMAGTIVSPAVNSVPEPGSLAMAGLGLFLAGFARSGRGRRPLG
jgi:hypothetical protein